VQPLWRKNDEVTVTEKQESTGDAVAYPRFSESNTAFNALSRDLGVNWQELFYEARTSLVAMGKASQQEPLDQPDDALFHFAFSEGFDRINVLTANWGSGKSNQGALRWGPPLDFPEAMLARRSTDPVRLTREVKRVARLTGAALIGVTELDPCFVYSDVQRNHCSSETPIRKPIHIIEAEYPEETDEALILPKSLRYVIVMALPMDREMISTAPSLLSEAATSLGYSHAAAVTLSVAAYIHALGYQAIPSLNGTALNIPLAVQAGLGEIGRNGLLITKEYGACVRLCKVFTDMPLLLDGPADLGIHAYCEVCGECTNSCPVGAISKGTPSIEGNNECNRKGVVKWPVDCKKCLRYWIASGTSCSTCIASCPFTMGNKWWGGLPQWLIRHTSCFNRALVWLDHRFAARKRRTSSGFLDRIPNES